MDDDGALNRLQRHLGGRYRVEHELGRGAMARVFLATELKHNRQVAIKLLHPDLSGQLGAERFVREIRVTASLQHPHILPLYDSGRAGGLLYYVTSFVEGETLRARLQRERVVPVDEAVTIIRTLATALDFAHRHGVIHRDIKPENILLQDGQPILADFGIALALSRAADDRVTGTGLSVGTPHYMSPEQAAGAGDLGPQSDIYSLGAVGYEMLVGEPPVTGPTREAVLARAMVEAPRAISPVRPTVPPALERAILKALAKNPVDRFRTAASFAEAIDAALLASGASTAPPREERKYVMGLALGVGVLALAAAAALVFVRPSRTNDERPEPAWRQITFTGDVRLAAISPDGRSIAYTTRGDAQAYVLVRDVQGGVPDTIAALPAAYTIEWSPDGNRILVGGHSQAVVISRYGGTMRSIEAAAGFPAYVLAHWLPEGLRVSLHNYAAKRVLIVNLETEDSVSVPIQGDFTWMEEGAWSPDGTQFAVGTQSAEPPEWAIRLVSMDGQTETVVRDTVAIGTPQWGRDGASLYLARDGDAIERIVLHGRSRDEVRRLQRNLQALPGGAGTTGRYSISDDGRHSVFVRGTPFANLVLIEAGDQDRAARATPLTTGTAPKWSPTVSPDGRWIAFGQAEHGASELMRMPIDGGQVATLTQGAHAHQNGRIAWSPSGGELAFTSARPDGHQVIVANVRTGRLRPFPQARVSDGGHNLAWSPGALIAYQLPGNRAIHLLDPASGINRALIDDDEGFFHAPQFSPDGRSLAVKWNRGADDESIWVVSVHDSMRRRAQDSARTGTVSGGPYPIGWSADGRHIYAAAGAPIIRLDSRIAGLPDTVVVRSSSGSHCTTGGRFRPGAFICAVADRRSDVWLIENFDPLRP